MGLPEIGFVSETLFKLLELFGFKYLSNRQKAEKYIAECLQHAELIIELDAYPNDKADYSHEIVKRLYVGASESIGELVSANNLAKVMQALSAARIYYWVKQYDGKPSAEIVDLIDDRLKRINQRAVRHHSLEYLIKKLKEVSHIENGKLMHDIESIKENCLADIAELKELALNVSISKARAH